MDRGVRGVETVPLMRWCRGEGPGAYQVVEIAEPLSRRP
jgi:hypothetical protein